MHGLELLTRYMEGMRNEIDHSRKRQADGTRDMDHYEVALEDERYELINHLIEQAIEIQQEIEDDIIRSARR